MIPNSEQNRVQLANISLRTSAFVTSLAASCVTFTSKQTTLVFDVPMHAKYSYSLAFKFYAFVTAIASVFSFVSLISTLILRWKGSLIRLVFHGNLPFMFFLHDLVMVLLLLGASAAATAIGYVGKYGNDHAGWAPICDSYGDFCHKITVAIILGYVSLICYIAIIVISTTKSCDQIATAKQVQDM